MLPDVSHVLRDWEIPVTVKHIEKITADFVPADVVTTRTQLMVVQSARRSLQNAETLDWSLRHLLLHSRFDIELGELIEYNGADYRVVERGEWSPYGYLEAVAEETKRPLVV